MALIVMPQYTNTDGHNNSVIFIITFLHIKLHNNIMHVYKFLSIKKAMVNFLSY